MYFDDYLTKHVLGNAPPFSSNDNNKISRKKMSQDDTGIESKLDNSEDLEGQQGTKYYLAQHLLFSQIPALENDIFDPVYTSLSDELV